MDFFSTLLEYFRRGFPVNRRPSLSDDYVGPGVLGTLVESYRNSCLHQKPIFIYPAASWLLRW